MFGIREGGLYKLKWHPKKSLVHNEVSSSEIWHIRFSHLHYRALPILRKLVTGLPDLQNLNEGVCKSCALRKNSRKKFPSSNNRAKGIMDIIHSDVCGKITVPSLGNFLYYVAFIDGYSRKTWIYLLKSKDEVFNKFQEFKASVENLIGKKIKILRSYNGGEYTSNEFKAL